MGNLSFYKKKKKKHRILATLVFILVLFGGILYFFNDIARLFYPVKHREYVLQYATEYDLDEYLIVAVIRTESHFNHEAVSHRGAKGLMQLMDETAIWAAEKIGIDGFKTEQLFDPNTNIRLGSWFLNWLSQQFTDEETIIAAYNAGNNKVETWLVDKAYSDDGITLKDIPYEETRNYVRKVKNNIYMYKILYPDGLK